MQHLQISGVISLFVFGLSLLAVGRVIRDARFDASSGRGMLRFAGIVLLAAGVWGVCALAIGNAAFVPWLVIMFVWLRTAMQYRLMQKRNLFSALSLAIERQMPLAPMARAFASECEGGFAARCDELAARLEAGEPFAEVAATSHRALPPEAALAANVGQQTGNLPQAVTAITYGQAFDAGLVRPLVARVYALPVLVIFYVMVYSFLTLKIAPTYAKILEDFGIDSATIDPSLLGTISDYSMGLSSFGLESSWQANLWFPRGLPVLLSLSLVLSFWGLLLCCLLAVWIWLQWRGTLRPRLPVLRRIVHWVDMAPVLRLIGQAAQENRSLLPLLVTISRYHPKSSLGKRLWNAVCQMNDGGTWQDSLMRQKLLGKDDAAVLIAAQRQGNLAWAAREMAGSFERRATYRLQAILQVITPLLVLPMGLLIALTAVAYFYPLVVLTKALSG